MLYVFLLALTLSHCHGLNLMQTLAVDSEESMAAQLIATTGLASTLSSGEYTVFAPTDAALAKLAHTADIAENLVDLVKYHVIQGKVTKDDITNDQTVTTLAGKKLRLNVYKHNNVVTVNGVPLTGSTLVADNGVIHRLSGVLQPPVGNIMDMLISDSRFSSLVPVIEKSGMTGQLKVEPLTFFAPTNQAVQKLANTQFAWFFSVPSMTKEVLLKHAMNHTVYSAGMYNSDHLISLNAFNHNLLINIDGSGKMKVDGVAITQADITATNGVIHVIDDVLYPFH